MEVERLCKALEGLLLQDGFTDTAVDSGSPSHTKKSSFIRRRTLTKHSSNRNEKASLCALIADGLTSGAAVRNTNKDFIETLSLAINILTTCCDDKDADTRLAAEEALTRTCQVHIASHPVIILVDLFKVLKLNGNVRSVGAAWKRLSHFSSYIRPQRFRCRAFMINLLPCIINLAQREEDALHEGLTEGLPLILQALGSFILEREIKRLVRAFLPNLSSESGVKRRAAASCIVESCLCSKKQTELFEWLLRGLTGMIQSSADNASSHLHAGTVFAIRAVIAATKREQFNGDSERFSLDILVQVLRTLVAVCDHSDHNVQGFALDALQTLLKNWDKPLLGLLSSTGDLDSRGLSPSRSEESFDFDRESEHGSDVIVDEETIKKDGLRAEYFGTVENLKMHLGSSSRDSVVDQSDTVSIISSAISEDIFNSEMTETTDDREEDRFADSSEDNVFAEDRPESGQDVRTGSNYENESVEIGRLFDKESTPAEFIARLLVRRFLLESNDEIRKDVRVSVLSAALGCLATLLQNSPSIFLTSLSLTQPNGKTISDVCLIFLQHSDPLLKAHGAVLSCQLIFFTVDNPLSTFDSSDVPGVLKKTIQLLKEQSPQACRLAVEALRKCVEALLYSDTQANLALDIFHDILGILRDPKVTYWLLKIDLLRFLRVVPVSHLLYVESVYDTFSEGGAVRRDAFLKEDLLSCLVHHLSVDDHRLRMAAADTLTWLPTSMAVPPLMSMHTYRILGDMYEKHCSTPHQPFQPSMRTGLVFPYNVNELSRSLRDIEDSLSSVVGVLFDNLIIAQEKDTITGLLVVLCKLSRYHPTTVYSRSWFGVIEETDLSMEKYTAPVTGILSRMLEVLTSASVAADVQLQSYGLELIGNMFSGLALTVYVKPKPEIAGNVVPWSHIGCFQLRTVADNLLRHVAKVLNLVRAVVESLRPSEIFAPTRTAVNLLASAVPGTSLSLRRRQESFRRSDKKSKVGSFELRSKFHLGALTTPDVYAPLYENIKKSWNKKRTELGKSDDKCSVMVRSTIVCFAQLLEMSNAEVLSPNVDELVAYLKIAIGFHGQSTIYCVEQLLRCLFGCNLAQTDCLNLIREVRGRFSSSSFDSDLLVSFVEQFSPSNSSVNFCRFPIGRTSIHEQSMSSPDDRAWNGRWERLLESHRIDSLEALFRGHFKEKRTVMSETIRQFESVVIKSLQLYTCTSESGVQAQVLDLLVLLLQLHVNYNVLDGDHVFFKYVGKQVELIEAGEITKAESLLPYIFRFFIHLSHDKVFSQQNVLTFGHIIQNCDSLMASSSHSGRLGVLPVLNLLVDDALHRKSSGAPTGMDEKEAQLEVLLSVALRCLPDLKAFSIVKKFLQHQVTLSAGHFEKHVSDLAETVFQRLLPNALSNTLFSDTHFIQEVLDFGECLRLIGCNPLMESISFRNFFPRLLEQIQQMTPLNLTALSIFCCIIDLFVANVAIEPLLKLFHEDSRQIHPLADQLDVGEPARTEQAVAKFVRITTVVFDSLFDVNTTTIDDVKQQELDYIYCTLLSTLSYFVHIVDQGPVKEALRSIQSTNKLEQDEKYHLNPVCRIAWFRFRYAATGVDLEPRFWQPDVNFPIEDHICEVTWKFLQPRWSLRSDVTNKASNGQVESSSLAPFTDPNEAQRLVEDFFENDVSILESVLYHRYCLTDVATFFRNIVVCAKEEENRKWLASLICSAGSLSVHQSFLTSLSETVSEDNSSTASLIGKELSDVSDAWVSEKDSLLKEKVLQFFGCPKRNPESTSGILQAPEEKAAEFQHDDWVRSLAFHVALESCSEAAQSVVALLADLEEETIVTILSDERFPVCFLKDCFRYTGGARAVMMATTGKLAPLFQAARMVFFQRLKEFHGGDSVDKELDRSMWLILSSSFIELAEKTNGSPSEISEEVAEDCFTLISRGFEMLKEDGQDSLSRRRTLQCTILFLQNSNFMAWARRKTNTVPALVSHIYALVISASPLAEEVTEGAESSSEMEDASETSVFAKQVMELSKLMDKPVSSKTFSELEHAIFTSLTKFPSVAEIVRIPPLAYELGWLPGKVSNTDPMPVDILQEPEVLKQFVSRICRYGWTSKRQFEETWMAFLSILSSVPIDEENEADESQHELSVNSRLVAGRLALRCITSLLLQSVLAVEPRVDEEKKNCVTYKDSWAEQFAQRSRRTNNFHHGATDPSGQTYHRWVMKGSPQPGLPNEQIDLKSCLKFVMDLYSHWTSDEKLKKLSPYILDEVVKSVMHLSTIFYEEKNHRWMHLFVKQVLRIKGVDDSLFYGHLLDALGIALGALDEDRDTLNLLKKAIETRSGNSLMNRISCGRVVLRLLRQPSFTEDPKVSHWLQSLSASLYESEYQSRTQSADALDILFSILVAEVSLFEPSGKQTVNPYVEVLLSQLKYASTLSFSTLQNLTSDLRTHVAEQRADDGVFREQLIKAGLDSISLNPPRSLLIVSFLTSCMENTVSKIVLDRNILSGTSSPSVVDDYSDPLFILAMEKMAVIQQRRQKSYHVETEALGKLYLNLLTDKMPLNEATNRVMAEFQSCSKESAPGTARLVTKVFDLLKRKNMDTIIEEWIALSFCNFANRLPTELGIWSLTCLFCAASSTSLTALFPFLVQRGIISSTDAVWESVFLILGTSFYSDIEVDETKKLFRDAVRSSVNIHPVYQRLWNRIFQFQSTA